MKQSVWTTTSNPTAFVTKNKQRIKQFEGQVYLNDGDEYQIEIFNPQPNHILAKIKVDNTYLSGGGIVLRPGERVFLERFLDSNNKFVFRTYEVGNEAVNVGAIDNNGYVEIDFFSESTSTSTYWGSNNTLPYHSFTTHTTGTPTIFTTNALGISGTTNTAYYSNTGTLTSNISNAVNTLAGTNIRSTKIETGTTEKGDSSNQQFTSSDRTFNSYSFHNVAWRILPTSTKQYHKEDLGVLYCGECGAKRKKDTHKFCPHCGTKF